MCGYFSLTDLGSLFPLFLKFKIVALQTLLTSNLLHQDRLRKGHRGAAATSVHSYHTDFQTVTSGLVLYDIAARFLQLLIDRFPFLS